MTTDIVATFNDATSAAPLKERLAQLGIEAEIYDERKIQRYWFASEPIAGVKLRVNLQDYVRARHLLHEWHKMDGALRTAFHCPQCDSSRVEYPQVTRKFASPNVVEALFALHLMERRFYCLDCHYTWAKQSAEKVETDLLGWPKEGGYFHHKTGPVQKPAGRIA